MTKTGGAREGAGRPKGSLNKRSADTLADALAAGLTPVEYMLEILRDPTADEKRRDWAAEKSAPYLHPRPTPTDRTVTVELPDTSTIAGINMALDRIIAAMGSGTISPSEGASFISAIEGRRKAIETTDLMDRIKKREELKK